ncbi:MAG: 4Fe-4S dicluster domain-containing protein [Dehalococcoidia bacterium]|nr:4Fe-4S dicluster domain-containing protein [Dehalococcoidia bacterium]
MCEFCHKHGEGKKWYLQAKNYSEDLMSDLRRRKFIADFFSKPEDLAESMGKLEKLSRAPAFVKGVLAPYISGRQKKIHFGQVLPMEDIERIFGFVSSVIRTACLCRQENLGTEQRYCYGISMAPQGGGFRKIIEEIDASYLTGPDTAGLEALTKEEALDSFREHEKEGLCHSVWTFITPFIGGICNCDRSDCYAMRATVTYGIPVMFRAEYVAEVNPELCNGCRQCMRVCQFGAMGYSAANKKVVIDPRRCYGCGVCRASCTKDAITLNDRTSVPIAASIW